MEILHTTECVARWEDHPYSAWSDDKKNVFLESLVRVIAHHVEYACAVVVLPSGLEALRRQHSERSAAGKPSLGDKSCEICADTCVGLINIRLERTGRTSRRVAYVFEHGDPGQGIDDALIKKASEGYTETACGDMIREHGITRCRRKRQGTPPSGLVSDSGLQSTSCEQVRH